MYIYMSMKIRRLLFWGVGACMLCSCTSREKAVLEPHTFTIDTVYAHTPVMNQGRTQTCWSYTTASLLESEWLAREKDTLRLSPMYVARQKYLKQFDEYYYSQGYAEMRGGSLGHSFVRIVREDGLLPLEVYRGCPPDARGHDHRKLLKALKRLAGKAVDQRDFARYRQQAVALLDKEMGAVPDTFIYKGVTYTPRSFTDSLRMDVSQCRYLTSFTHHPFYTSFALEVPDNWGKGLYENLPLDELEAVVRTALQRGHTVAWDGDVSEKTFSAVQGMAVYPEHPVTQASRQKGFDAFETTDDHMMHIVGTAHDEQGRFYYLLKNSWGRGGKHKGFIYMSEDYFRAKTVSVMLGPSFSADPVFDNLTK